MSDGNVRGEGGEGECGDVQTLTLMEAEVVKCEDAVLQVNEHAREHKMPNGDWMKNDNMVWTFR